MKKAFLISFLLVALSIISFSSEELSSQNVDTIETDNGVILTLNDFDKLLDLGFNKKEINSMTPSQINELTLYNGMVINETNEYHKIQEDLDDFGNVETLNEIITKEVFYEEMKLEEKTDDESLIGQDLIEYNLLTSNSTSNENLVDSINGNLISSTPVISSNSTSSIEENCVLKPNDKTCYKTMSNDGGYGILNMSLVYIGNNEFLIKTSFDWKKVPKTHRTEAIGFAIPSELEIVTASYGAVTVQEKTETYGVDEVKIFQQSYDYTNSGFEVESKSALAFATNFSIDSLYEDTSEIYISTWARLEPESQSVYEDFIQYGSNDFNFKGIYIHFSKYFSIDSLGLGIDVGAGGITAGISLNVSAKEHSTTISYPTDLKVSDINESEANNVGEINRFYDEYFQNGVPITSLYNDNRVFIDRDTLYTLHSLGFHYIEIMNLTQSEVNEYENLHINRFVGYSLNESSSYKRLELTVNYLTSGHYFVKLNMKWTDLPKSRTWDLLGVGTPAYSSNNLYKGKQIVGDFASTSGGYDVYSYTMTNNSSYFSSNAYGVVMKHNLLNDANYMLVTLEVYSSGGSYGNDFTGIIMHQTDSYSISNSQFKMAYNGTSIAFNPTSLSSDYDTQYKTSVRK